MKKRLVGLGLVVLLLAVMVTSARAMWGSGARPPAEKGYKARVIVGPVVEPEAASDEPGEAETADGLEKRNLSAPRLVITPMATLAPYPYPEAEETLPGYPYPEPDETLPAYP